MKKQIVCAGLALFLALLLSGCDGIVDSSAVDESETDSAPTWQEQYDLGMRYLTEGNYSEAVIAFTKAIEIDPKQSSLYTGRGDAYLAWAQNESDLDAAQRYYDAALKDYESAQGLGDSTAAAKASDVREAIERLKASEEYSDLLEPLFTLFSSGDMTGAASLMRRSEYVAMSESAADSFYVYESGGMSVAAYPDCYYYYGTMTNGARVGHGIWMRAVYGEDNRRSRYIYDGEWANDMPNGSGHIVEENDINKMNIGPNMTSAVTVESTGTFSNGLYNGTFDVVWYMNDGGVHAWMPILAVNGVFQPMANVPESILQREYTQQRIERGEWIVAVDSNNESTDLWDSGTVRAVAGFR